MLLCLLFHSGLHTDCNIHGATPLLIFPTWDFTRARKRYIAYYAVPLHKTLPAFDRLIRQLKDFEETLEASSSARKKKVNAFHLGKPPSSAIAQIVRKAPLRGKRWRTKAAPWPGQG